MTPTETVTITHVAELLAHNGYDVAPSDSGVLRVRELHSGIGFQVALEGRVVFMSVNLMTLPAKGLTPELMKTMLSGSNGISTSSFRLFDLDGGKTAVTLTNFCKIQDMGPEDRDDILSLANYLLADVVAARDLIHPAAG